MPDDQSEMIHDVDETLRALIERDVIDAGVDISFEAPNKEWASRQNKPTVNAFLYDIREDVSRRDVAPQPVRDESGVITGRRPPARRLRLSYLLTAWTQRPEDEHRLLSALLRGFLRGDQLPEAAIKRLAHAFVVVQGICILHALCPASDIVRRDRVFHLAATQGYAHPGIDGAGVQCDRVVLYICHRLSPYQKNKGNTFLCIYNIIL